MFLDHLKKLFYRQQLGLLLSIILGVLLVFYGFQNGTEKKVVAFLFTMLGCFLLTEFFIHKKNLKVTSPVIRQARIEILFILFVQIVGIALLVFRFFMIQDFQNLAPGIKIGMLILRLLFMYPLLLLIYFLGIRRYSLKQIGFVGGYWYLALPLMALIGLVSVLFFPEGLQFEQEFTGKVFLNFILLGLLTAAIPEELSRYLFQTRLNKVLSNKSISWFLVALIWAAAHIPLFSNGDNSIKEATISALGIMPIGLLWGYLNERFQSIIPSVLIHSTNLWGLQNIF